ncbi:MAG: hypothetical protein QM704_26880 [Anaeromyxobacteraceae bacterium]
MGPAWTSSVRESEPTAWTAPWSSTRSGEGGRSASTCTSAARSEPSGCFVTSASANWPTCTSASPATPVHAV